MRNLYWNQTGIDAHWDTLEDNWWLNEAYDDPALSLPTTGDFVYLRGATAPDTAPSVAVELFGFDTQGLTTASLYAVATENVSIQSGGVLTMGYLPWAGHAWGGITAATGTFTFNGSANWGTVGDYATVNGSSDHDGIVGDYATFNDNSVVWSTTGVYATFNDGSASEGGTIGDYATFNDDSYNFAGTVGDYVTINSTALQYGTWLGTTFYIGEAVVFDSTACLDGTPPIEFVMMNKIASLDTFGLETKKFSPGFTVKVSFNQTNLESENIKKDIPILGEVGTLAERPPPMLVV